jgi:hypothetical protein
MRGAYVLKASGGVAGAAIAALLAALAIASPAAAAPKGIFSVFGGCPASEVSGEGVCVNLPIVGGMLVIGRATVPVDRTITVQAGAQPAVTNLFDLLPPRGGTTLSKTPLEVPGGLNGLVQCGAIGGRLAQASCGAAQGTEVTATIEVVANSSDPATLNTFNFFGRAGTSLVLPMRVHLSNVFLGNSCYLGSGSHPIIFEMTLGATSPPAPNKPISGSLGRSGEEYENGLELLAFGSSVLVDNAFAVPAAEGCGGQFSSLVNPIVDAKLGLPSKAGHNTAIIDAKALDIAYAENVLLSEG